MKWIVIFAILLIFSQVGQSEEEESSLNSTDNRIGEGNSATDALNIHCPERTLWDGSQKKCREKDRE